MILLAPGAGLVAAALAGPALVLLYFLKLRRRPLRVSSTLLWQQAAMDMQVNVPFRWLRASWLLAIQLLALAALVTAVARPALRGGPDLGRRVLILIDRSASMSCRDVTGEDGSLTTRLDEAKRRAVELIDALMDRPGAAPAVTIGAFSTEARVLSSADQGRAGLSEAAGSITPTDQPGSLSAAVALARAIATDAGGEQASEPLTLVLLSDGGFGPEDVPAGKGLLVRYERVGPAGASVDNAGIVALAARRDYDDPASLRVFTRVINASKAERAVTLRMTLDGRVVDERVLTLPAPSPGEAGGPERPGEASATLTITGREGGVLVARLLEPDALVCDNTAGVVVPTATPVRMLLVGPGVGGRDADPFLLSLLSNMDEVELRVVDEAAYEQLAGGGGPAWAFDLVILDRVKVARSPACASVSFACAPPDAGVEVVEGDARGGRPVSWRRDHPLLRYVNFDSVFVRPMVRLIAGGGTSRVTDLVDGADGPLVALVEPAGGHRRLVVGFELARSNWPPNVSFPLFVQNTIDYLTLRAELSGGRGVRTGEAVVVKAAAGAGRIDLVPELGEGPVEAVLSAPVPERDRGIAGAAVSLGVVERTGLYRARGATPATERVAVNLLDPVETAARVADDLVIPGGRGVNGAGAGTPREIWSWFVLGALVLLSVEWLVYGWRMRER